MINKIFKELDMAFDTKIVKDFGDFVAGAIGLGSFFNLLPALAAFMTIVWTFIRIYEWYRVRIRGHDPIPEKVVKVIVRDPEEKGNDLNG